MARAFSPTMNAVARGSLVVLALLVVAAGWTAWAVENSSYVTWRQVRVEQPVPFSHEHHVGALGLSCRYCHSTVTKSSFAGMPSTKTCMTCHSQIWTNSPILAPVRESWRSGRPIAWRRVTTLPDYVYFSHDIHVTKGVGCATCHGRVDDMTRVVQEASLQMSWCLDCHRHPEQYLRPREEVFNMDYEPAGAQAALGRELVERYAVRDSHALSECSTCHR